MDTLSFLRAIDPSLAQAWSLAEFSRDTSPHVAMGHFGGVAEQLTRLFARSCGAGLADGLAQELRIDALLAQTALSPDTAGCLHRVRMARNQAIHDFRCSPQTLNARMVDLREIIFWAAGWAAVGSDDPAPPFSEAQGRTARRSRGPNAHDGDGAGRSEGPPKNVSKAEPSHREGEPRTLVSLGIDSAVARARGLEPLLPAIALFSELTTNHFPDVAWDFGSLDLTRPRIDDVLSGMPVTVWASTELTGDHLDRPTRIGATSVFRAASPQRCVVVHLGRTTLGLQRLDVRIGDGEMREGSTARVRSYCRLGTTFWRVSRLPPDILRSRSLDFLSCLNIPGRVDGSTGVGSTMPPVGTVVNWTPQIVAEALYDAFLAGDLAPRDAGDAVADPNLGDLNAGDCRVVWERVAGQEAITPTSELSIPFGESPAALASYQNQRARHNALRRVVTDAYRRLGSRDGDVPEWAPRAWHE